MVTVCKFIDRRSILGITV